MVRITILTNCTNLGKLITNQSKQTQKTFLLDCWPSPGSQGIRVKPGVRPRVRPRIQAQRQAKCQAQGEAQDQGPASGEMSGPG